MASVLLMNCIKKMFPGRSRRERRHFSTGSKRPSPSSRPTVEVLEDRITPSNFNVTDLADTAGSASDVTLRYAVTNATSGTDTITFDASLNGGTITLTSSLTLGSSVTITGPGAAQMAVSGGNAHEVFNIAAAATASISGLTIENGVAGHGGGINNAGTLTLTNDAVSNNGSLSNTTNNYGAGIYNSGTLTISGSTINNNSSYTDGGGIYNTGTLTVSDSTLFANAAYTTGGGISNAGGTLTLTNDTIAGNVGWGGNGNLPSGGGGGISNSGTMTMNNTIVTGNAVSDVTGTYTGSYDLVGGVTGVATTLAYNGGPTQSLALSSSSSARGVGDPSQAGTPAQNGLVRPATPAIPDVGAYQTPAPTVTTSTANLPSNATSMVINGLYFSSNPANDSVTYDNGVTGTVTGATGTSLTVSLSGLTTVSPSTALHASVSVFGQSSGSPVQVATVAAPAHPTVTASTTPLADSSTTIIIQGSNFDPQASDNSVAFNLGVTGTITAATATQLTVNLTTAPSALGSLTAVVTSFGIAGLAPAQVATEVNGTWTVTDTNGNLGSGTLNDVTLPYAVATSFSGDTIGFASSLTGRTITTGSTLTLHNNITISGQGAPGLTISSPPALPNIPGLQYQLDASNAGSLVTDGSGGVTQWNDLSGNNNNFAPGISGQNPLLVPNAFGSLPALQFSPTSNTVGTPLVGANNVNAKTVFIVNFISGTSSAGCCDGIWGEYGNDFSERVNDGNPTQFYGPPNGGGNGNDYPNNGGGSTWISEASSFDQNTTVVGPLGTANILAVTGNLTPPITQIGGGSYSTRDFVGDIGEVLVYNTQLTSTQRQGVEAYLSAKWLSGAGAPHQVFNIASGANVTISDLTITNGSSASGGGVANAGTLTLSGDAITGNSAAKGGGVYNAGALTVVNSTVANNTASVSGGGIYNSATGTLTLSNATIAYNTATTAGGGVATLGATTIQDTIVASNTGGDVSGTVAVVNYSMIGNSAGLTITSGSNNVLNPSSPGLAAALANNGGPTKTLAILAGSPALFAGGAITSVTTGDPIGLTDTTIHVQDAAAIAQTPGSYYILIGQEKMLVTNVDTTANTLTVQRGVNGTTAATHAAGASVYQGIDQRGTSRLTLTTIGAIEDPLWIVTDPNGAAGSGSPTDVTLPFAVNELNNGIGQPVIEFANGVNSPINLTGDTITLDSALQITGNYTIQGLGSANLTVSGNHAVSVFSVASGATAGITGLTIDNGAGVSGGGIFNAGTLTLTSDLISGNTATANGGGIYNAATGNLTLAGDVLTGNAASNGGGIYNTGTLTFSDSSSSGNTASGTGSGIYNATAGFTTISSSTTGTTTISDNIFCQTNSGLTLNGAGTTTIAGNINLVQGNLTDTSSGQDAVTGVISSSSTIVVAGNGVIKSGPGTLTLSNANTYIGSTTINGGKLVVTVDGAMGPATDPGIIVNGGALAFSGGVNYATLEPTTISGSGPAGNGAIENISGANTFAAPITLAANAAIGADAGTLTISNPNLQLALYSLTGTGAGNVVISSDIQGTPVTTGYVGFTGGTGGANSEQDILNWNYTSGATNVNYGSGFTTNNLSLNGGASVIGSGALQLTDGNNSEARTAWTPTPVSINNFTSTFQWTYGSTVPPNADGFTFTVQESGPTAVGGGGGSLGYSGIGGTSLAFQFNLYNNVNTFGIGANGLINHPIDLMPDGIDFHTNPGDIYQATITQTGASVTVSIWDTTLNPTTNPANYTQTFTVSVINSLIKTGAGTLTLTHANAYTGSTIINGGTLIPTVDGAMGPATAAGIIINGGALGFTGGLTYATAEPTTIAGSGPAGNGAIENISGTNSFAAPITLTVTGTGTGTVGSDAGDLTLSGNINLGSTGNLVATGAGNTTITGVISGTATLAETPGLIGTYFNIGAAANLIQPASSSNAAWLGNQTPSTAQLIGPIDFPNISTNGFADSLSNPAYYNFPGNNNNVEARWYGDIIIPGTGTTPVPINFATTSDDGSMLYIDGNVVVNNNFFQPATQRTGLVNLTPGLHTIDIEYYQGVGGASMIASWDTTGGTTFVDIPNSAFVVVADTLTKNGAGKLTLTNTDTYLGPTTVNGGKLTVDGHLPNTTMTVNNSGTLSGDGTVPSTTVNSGGTLQPGDSPGTTTAASLTMTTGSFFTEEIGGATAGTQYDQVVIPAGGTVDVTGAALNVQILNGFTPVLGEQFTIISNLGGSAVTGQFSPTSNIFTGAYQFSVNYAGNGGNDVVLTLVNITTATTLTLVDNGPNPSSYGQTVSFTATLASTATVPNGLTVTLEDASHGNAVVGTGTTSSGSVTFTTSTLGFGTHNLFAVFGGNTSLGSSQSSQVTQTVNDAPSTGLAVFEPFNYYVPTNSVDPTVNDAAAGAIVGEGPGLGNTSTIGLTGTYTSDSVGGSQYFDEVVPGNSVNSGSLPGGGSLQYPEASPPAVVTPVGNTAINTYGGNSSLQISLSNPLGDAMNGGTGGTFWLSYLIRPVVAAGGYGGVALLGNNTTQDGIFLGYGASPQQYGGSAIQGGTIQTPTYVQNVSTAVGTPVHLVAQITTIPGGGVTVTTYINPGFGSAPAAGSLLSTFTSTDDLGNIVALATYSGSQRSWKDEIRVGTSYSNLWSDPTAQGATTTLATPASDPRFNGVRVPAVANSDYGGATNHSVNTGFNYITSNGTGVSSSLIVQFDNLSSYVPAGDTITGAKVIMTGVFPQNTYGAGLIPTAAYNVTSAWNDSAAGATPTVDTSAAVATGTGTMAVGQYSYDITALAQGWLSGSITNNGIDIAQTDSTNFSTNLSFLDRLAGGFHSGTGTYPLNGDRPVLVLTLSSPTAPTTTTLTDNGPNPSNSGDAVSFTATVAGGTAITGQTVFIEDADASNAVVASPTLSGGTVTFNISSLSVGTHHLFAVYNGDATHASSNSSLTPVAQVVNAGGAAPAVSSVVVNGGPPAYTDGNGLASTNLAGQNSVVEQILVTFNEAVTLDAGAFTITNNAALVVVNNGPTPNTAAVSASFAVVPSTGNTEFIVTFSGPGTITGGGTGNVIKDGLYTLNTIGSHVHANSQTAADNNTKFWALYGSVVGADNNLSSTLGDGNSEVFVDNFDYSAFKTTFGSETDIPTGIPYNVGLDGDLNGFVDNFDYSEFKGNFGADWSF